MPSPSEAARVSNTTSRRWGYSSRSSRAAITADWYAPLMPEDMPTCSTSFPSGSSGSHIRQYWSMEIMEVLAGVCRSIS